MIPSTAHRMYYLAIHCPGELDQKIIQEKLWMLEKFGCRIGLKSPAHITIIPPFLFDCMDETHILKSVSSFQSSVEFVDIELTHFDHFTNRVLYICVNPNELLYRIKDEAENHFIHQLGGIIKKATTPFIPHITIANRDLKPADFNKAWGHFMNRKFEAIFKTQQISLLRLEEGKWSVIMAQNWHKAQ